MSPHISLHELKPELDGENEPTSQAIGQGLVLHSEVSSVAPQAAAV